MSNNVILRSKIVFESETKQTNAFISSKLNLYPMQERGLGEEYINVLFGNDITQLWPTQQGKS